MWDDYLDQIKENHSKFAILIWVVYGVYVLFTNQLNGIVTLVVYFFGGIFIASFASILIYLLQQGIVKILVKTKPSDVVPILLSYVLLVVEVVWIVFVARLFLPLINNI